MKKLAGDANHRIFQALPDYYNDESFNRALNKDTLLQCFIKGESKSNWSKAVTKKKVDVGREIKVYSKTGKKKYSTADLFEKPTCVWKKDDYYWFTAELVPLSGKYLFRHAFDFEKKFCLEPVGFDNDIFHNFKTLDKYDQLSEMKKLIINELVHQFLAEDVKIVSAMTEVLNDHFNNTNQEISSLNEKFETFLQNQNQSTMELMEAMKRIERKLENATNDCHVAELQHDLEEKQKELDRAKISLEQEKFDRRKSRLNRTTLEQHNYHTSIIKSETGM